MTKHITKFKIASRSGARGWKCRACVNADQRDYYEKTHGQYLRNNDSPLSRAIAKARIPDDARYPNPLPAKYWNDWKGAWDDALVLGEHVTEHGERLWWLAILTVRSSPFVGPVDKEVVRVLEVEAA